MLRNQSYGIVVDDPCRLCEYVFAMIQALTPHQYVNQVINQHRVITGLGSPPSRARSQLLPLIRRWAGKYFLSMTLSGSYAKGTAISIGTDADLFISLASSTPFSLSEIYWNLFWFLQDSGYSPVQQNVSIGIWHDGLKLDLVPGRRHVGLAQDHSLYRSKADTWTQTNVSRHISRVANSQRLREIRALKIWRERHHLEFPSFYLELITIEALRGHSLVGNIADKVTATLRYISENLASTRIIDPANTNNTISDDLTTAEKRIVMNQAAASLAECYWEDVLW